MCGLSAVAGGTAAKLAAAKFGLGAIIFLGSSRIIFLDSSIGREGKTFVWEFFSTIFIAALEALRSEAPSLEEKGLVNLIRLAPKFL